MCEKSKESHILQFAHALLCPVDFGSPKNQKQLIFDIWPKNVNKNDGRILQKSKISKERKTTEKFRSEFKVSKKLQRFGNKRERARKSVKQNA